MKNFKISLLLTYLFVSFTCFSQAKKKIAVVAFYADKQVSLEDVGLSGVSSIADLQNNPDFKLDAILKKYHDAFFTEYAKKFPFDLVPESEVTGNPTYQAYQPTIKTGESLSRFTSIEGYKTVTGVWGKQDEKDMLKIFPDVDGVMFVYVTFSLNKGFGVGGTATTKMQAFTSITLYNRKAEKVFSINEHANSKKTGVMVGGVPVMTPEKILPMCESALTELMEDLGKRIQKIVDKSSKKL